MIELKIQKENMFHGAYAITGISGCITWYGDLIDIRKFTDGGQDIFVRVDAVELANTRRKSKGVLGKKRTLVILSLSIFVGVLILALCSYLLFKKMKTRGLLEEERSRKMLFFDITSSASHKGSPRPNDLDASRGKLDLPFYDLGVIVSATNSFSSTNKLGQGGFGIVYKVATSGYMSPEYAMDGLFSTKSDVSSFGVLLLEIISGKRNNGYYHEDPSMNLLAHTWNLWLVGRALDIIDSSMGDGIATQEVLKCIQVVLLCVQENATDRPTMSSVIFMLDNETTMPSIKQPTFILRSSPRDPDYSSTTGTGSCSINDMTIIAVECR
ncbi:hypothetical protein GIB67_016391 [Kingdonia uniflora]|uniref:Protein kinase domain-containing protein n=1 Tax=Kingdonia uniflora TaxID=39325 RepID=A0A7J7MGU9_9MAGN|nr:hypothetical protein GIB67_016391 [Kingdonia uniflora]